MFFKVLNKGFAGTNSYIIGDSNEAAVIDAGNNADDIFEAAVKEGIRIKYIILTHGHYDHMRYLDELRRKTNAKVAIHGNDGHAMKNTFFNVSSIFGREKVFEEADILLKDGDEITVGNCVLKIIHTPGHTPGGICIKCNDMLFTGDTLFDGDFGRTDLLGGSSAELKKSLLRILDMDENLMIYPGHDNSNKLKNIISKCKAGRLFDDENWI